MQDFIKSKARREIFKLKEYKPGKPIEEVKRELGIDDIIKLASNENPLGPSPKAVQAITEMLCKIHLYPDANCFELRNRLAGLFDLPGSSILIGNGSDELLKLIAETFLQPGDQVIIAEPTFSEYEFSALIMGAECIRVPLRGFTHDLQAMIDAVTPKTKMIVLCNPNNPTGTIVGKSEVEAFMDQVPDGILVVFDEAYYEYAESQDFISGLAYLRQGRNVMVLRTFSKIYGLAALRVGYAFTKPEIAQAILRVKEPFNVNGPAQVGALAALDDQEHVRKSQTLNHEGKLYLYREFEKLGIRYVPTEANFIFFDIGKNSREVFHELLKMGVIVRNGDVFGFPTFLRVTVGTAAENQRFINSLQQVLEQ